MKHTQIWKKALSLALSLAMLLSAAGLAALAEESEASFQEQLSAKYGAPDQLNMTEARWWLPEGMHTDETIIEEITALHDQGFVGFELCQLDEQGADPDAYGYGSESWAHDAAVAIETAAKLGMRVGITSGTHWTHANIPGLDPNDEAAGQMISISVTHLQPGEALSGALALPADVTDEMKLTFVGAYAYRAASYAESEGWGGLNYNIVLDSTREPEAIAVTEAGERAWNVDWTAPDDGEYVVFGMWQRGTWQKQEPAQQDSYAINYYNHAGVEALEEYLAGYYFSDPELVEAVKGADIQFFMDSLEINAGSGRSLYWSRDMREQFEAAKGYDIVPYLPLLLGIGTGACFTGAGNVEPDGTVIDSIRVGGVTLSGPDGATPDNVATWKIINDLYDLHTQLIKSEMMDPLRAWAKENYNMTLRAQMPYGTYMEASEMGMAMDYVETESLNMKDQTDSYRLWAGAAHILNTMYSSETGCIGGMNYAETLQDYIKIASLQFAGGVNRTIWHGHASSWGPEDNTNWPGFEGMGFGLSTRLDSREPNAQNYKEMNDYFGRVQGLLREGVARVDLGILHLNYGENTSWPTTYADWIGNHQGIYWIDSTLQDVGYTYDYFSPDYLNLMEYDPATGTLGATVGYQAIIVEQQRMPIDAATRLLELAKQGLKVLIVDDAATMTPYHNESDEELKAVIDELKALENVTVVASEAEAYPALVEMGVRPRAELADTNQIITVMREDEAANRYVWAYNYCDDQHSYLQSKTTNPASHGTLAQTSLSMDGAYIPYSIDPWTGEVARIASYRVEDGRTIIDLSLEYNDCALLAFEPAEAETLHAVASDAMVIETAEGFAIRATQSGSYTTEMSDGSRFETTVDVPAATELTGWTLSVEDWQPGELERRSETRATSVYHADTDSYEDVELTTEEVRWGTSKEVLNAELDAVTTWDNVPEIGRDVSGVGTYATTFTWDASAATGAYLDLGNILQDAVVIVNGQKTAPVDAIDPVIDLGGYLKDGENTLEIITCSTLANRMLALGLITEGQQELDGVDKLVGFNGYRCTYQSNGLSSATLIPYVDTPLAG